MGSRSVSTSTELAKDIKKRKEAIRHYFNGVASQRDWWKTRNRYYYRELENVCRFIIPENTRVLEIGTGTGDLLAAVKPSWGVGVDFSEKMVAIARRKYPNLEFIAGDAEALPLQETFDYVIMSDLVGHLQDVQRVLAQLHKVVKPETRLVLTYYNFIWEPVLGLGEYLGLKMPQQHQNWLSVADLKNLLQLTDFEVIKQQYRLLVPKNIPLLSYICNRFISQLPIIRQLCLVQILVARPAPKPRGRLSCSVVIPCRNERGNIEGIFTRTPEMGHFTELIFVDGNSTDGTVAEIERQMALHPQRKVNLIHQGNGTGKGDAVRKGFELATGDVLMILDADLTVPPEDLPKFSEALRLGKGEFINGTRLVYPLEDQAMRLLNYLGNKFFSVAFSWLLGQPLKDTLCGTKALYKIDYEKIKSNRHYFGDFDPFGDFDLILGASKLNLKIVEIPIQYRARRYGTTKISRFRHGWVLLKMTIFAYSKLKVAR